MNDPTTLRAIRGRRRLGRRVLWLLVAVACSALAADSDRVADRLLEELQEARAEAGAGELGRRDDLDAIARDRARAIAALPHEQRLTYEEPVGDQLRATGIRWFRSAVAHLNMVRGYTRPEIGLLRSWVGNEPAWARAVEPGFDSVGVASQRSADGWIVFVAVLVEEMAFPEDLDRLERDVIDAVNEVRLEHGLGQLIHNVALADVARQHSEDMARRDFVAHVNPEGFGAPERVDLAGIVFHKLGENIQMSRGSRDPVAYAVEQWMSSPGHRRTLLDGEFVRTGVGVALAENGSLYFTQLFLLSEE